MHLLIPRDTLRSLTVIPDLALRQNITNKSQNGAAMVQTFKEITGDTMGVISHKSLYG